MAPQSDHPSRDHLADVNSDLTIIRISLGEMYITDLTDTQRSRLHEAIDAVLRIAAEVHDMQAKPKVTPAVIIEF